MATETDDRVRRATGVLVIEVTNSNPNGDPDRESDPRQRHDQRGVISGVSFKRKLRDLVHDKEGPVWQELSRRFEIPAAEADRFRVLETREAKADRKAIDREVRDGTFVRKYWDARVFGNTFLEKDGADAMRTGAVQFALGNSVSPVRIERMTNTNKSGVQEGKDRGMAPLAYRIVEHGLYVMPLFVNPTAAGKSGCTPLDVRLLLALIPHAYPHTASHLRPFVGVRHAWYVEHASPLGSCSDFAIVQALTPRRKGDPDRPSSSAHPLEEQYEVPTALPEPLQARLGALRDLAQPS